MWRWVLLVIIVLLGLLCLTRVGVEAAFSAGGLRLDLRIGWFRLHLLPGKAPKRPQKPEKAPKPKKEKPETPPKKKRPAFTKEDLMDALRTMLPALRRLLRRTRRGLRISPLHLSITLGGRLDPVRAAKQYGQIQTAVWMGMPLLEKVVEMQEVRIHTEVDFDAAGTAVEGEAGAAFRIGTLLAMGCGLLFPALGWLLRTRRRKRSAPEKNDKTAAA